ncbi:MAG TPA: TrkA C-terminal domain-containing protein [Acidimicrobiales bacterium]|nr:TrkA C-terminal domain-containing protein [Acidimicrobiales bacterium]
MPVLAAVPVRTAMAPPRLVVTGATSVEVARQRLEHEGLSGAPVVDGKGRFEGTVSLQSLRRNGDGGQRQLGSFVDVAAPTVSEVAHLDVAIDAMTTATDHWVPVLDVERKVVGTIAISDVVRGYRLGLLASLQKMNAGGDTAGTDRLLIDAGSPLAGRSLRQSRLPLSVIVTTIQRNRDLVVPNGNTVLQPGDELVLIGSSSDIDAIRSNGSGNGESTELPPV